VTAPVFYAQHALPSRTLGVERVHPLHQDAREVAEQRAVLGALDLSRFDLTPQERAVAVGRAALRERVAEHPSEGGRRWSPIAPHGRLRGAPVAGVGPRTKAPQEPGVRDREARHRIAVPPAQVLERRDVAAQGTIPGVTQHPDEVPAEPRAVRVPVSHE